MKKNNVSSADYFFRRTGKHNCCFQWWKWQWRRAWKGISSCLHSGDAAERERERTILKREREREREATWQNQEGKDAKREGKKEGGGGG